MAGPTNSGALHSVQDSLTDLGLRLCACTRGVDRSALLTALRDKLPDELVRYDSPVSSFAFADDGAAWHAAASAGSGRKTDQVLWAGRCKLTNESGEQLSAGLVVGADGARSRVCSALGLGQPRFVGYAAYR